MGWEDGISPLHGSAQSAQYIGEHCCPQPQWGCCAVQGGLAFPFAMRKYKHDYPMSCMRIVFCNNRLSFDDLAMYMYNVQLYVSERALSIGSVISMCLCGLLYFTFSLEPFLTINEENFPIKKIVALHWLIKFYVLV